MSVHNVSKLFTEKFLYAETPTTGGNSNGAPCKFPFIYNGKEYYHCTTDHAESRRLWCATVSNYDQDPKWGYCPLSGKLVSVL